MTWSRALANASAASVATANMGLFSILGPGSGLVLLTASPLGGMLYILPVAPGETASWGEQVPTISGMQTDWKNLWRILQRQEPKPQEDKKEGTNEAIHEQKEDMHFLAVEACDFCQQKEGSPSPPGTVPLTSSGPNKSKVLLHLLLPSSDKCGHLGQLGLWLPWFDWIQDLQEVFQVEQKSSDSGNWISACLGNYKVKSSGKLP